MPVHIRSARPTDRLDEIAALYRDGLGLRVLADFRDHAGFDGVVLGLPGAGWEIEFTSQAGHEAGRAPTRDNLLVVYEADSEAWAKACASMESAGFEVVSSYNPYWDVRGRTFEDPDGYRVVVQNDRAPGERATED